LYEQFETQLIEKLSDRFTSKIETLNKEKWILKETGKKRQVDTLASAKAEGYDALLELTVWPSVHEQLYPAPTTISLKIDLKLTRIVDDKILWGTTYKTEKSGKLIGSSEIVALVEPAVNRAINIYGSK